MKQLRIVTLGDWNNYLSYFLVGSMEGAIRCGAWFRPIQLLGVDLSIVRKQIDFFKPHIILMHCIFNTKPEGWRENVFQLLRDTKKKWSTFNCYHMGDARKEPRYPNDISDFMDLGLVNNLEYKRWSTIWGIPCINWPYPCLYQKGIVDREDRFANDVVFTGMLGENIYHKERTYFISQLQKRGIDIKIYPDEEYGNSRFMTAEIASSANVVLGSQMGKDIFGYMDVRPSQYIGAGGIYMQDQHVNIEEFYIPEEHFLAFKENDIDDFLRKYEFGLTVKGQKIRSLGFQYAQIFHGTDKRMQNIIKIYTGRGHLFPTTLKEGGIL